MQPGVLPWWTTRPSYIMSHQVNTLITLKTQRDELASSKPIKKGSGDNTPAHSW